MDLEVMKSDRRHAYEDYEIGYVIYDQLNDFNWI